MKENNLDEELYKNYNIEEAAEFSDFEFEEVANYYNPKEDISK